MSTTTATWRPTSVQGLYEYRPAGLPESVRGVFYSRIPINGRRTFRSLRTKVYEQARLKHAQKAGEVEQSRQRGVEVETDFRTLGALLREVKARFAELPVAENTKFSRHAKTERLWTHWQRGAFDTFLARNVTPEVITEFRDYLLTKAPFLDGCPSRGVGLHPSTVNQTLWVLKVCLSLAVEKGVTSESPFSAPTVLRGNLLARQPRKDPATAQVKILSRPLMAAVFAEMRVVSDKVAPETRVSLQATAHEMADHAELLAYSGMRRNEATRSVVADDLGDMFRIDGSKTATSLRTIPVNPALRVVLDRVKARRSGPDAKLVLFGECRPALQAACVRLKQPEITNHGLRHFFASVCIASGVDVPSVSRWLGHADGGTLAMKTYGHLLADHSLAAAKRVNFSGDTDSRWNPV